ncbi:hypothetical protein BH11PSE8_BH11PSE8_17670 [soil metagenome]
MSTVQKIRDKLQMLSSLPARLDRLQETLGHIQAKLNQVDGSTDPRKHEFKVYSQWGEDGIIDHLASKVEIPNKTFIEFGVETYVECNTLFLLKHRNWSGLVIDGSADNVAKIIASETYWQNSLFAACSFITKDNINTLIREGGFAGDLGLLSVDIDGNDYWVWEAIDCVSPRIIVSEYNSLFGPTAKVSTPYQADFYRTRAHPSNMYYGASIAALTHQATLRGYSLVAGNSAGNNVFFVRNDCMGDLQAQSVGQAYVKAKFREAKSDEGVVQHLQFEERQAAIGHLPVVDVVTGRTTTVAEAL